ncbi:MULTISPECIES: SDR family oxidoreductase [Pseudomonas]|uniref:SDR family oxidoreductase n=1 Tax=Pseudomonas TaxID=286 RepID=UPI0018A966C7|nr:SDR family oxidoreductase [Pseudomonas guariconensis]MBF8720532.1 SDR family oxidoreductase [Pseudomonas guariconensis]MBF8792450.1 SDR family oxidoreductase [Pseudomonas monteilii]
MLLKDKVVMISGIGPGLGIKLALEAAHQGARALAICARSAERLEQARTRILALGHECQVLCVPTDITDTTACAHFAKATLEAFGRIDALVNSAFSHGGFQAVDEADNAPLREALEVNLLGSLNMSRAVLPAMREQGEGAIVMINTLGVRKPYQGGAAYSASKAALTASVRYLASEQAVHGIRVNALACGWMWGEPVQAVVRQSAEARGISEAQAKAEFSASIPGGRMRTDDECARAALFLASDYASAINGAQLDANGGELMS